MANLARQGQHVHIVKSFKAITGEVEFVCGKSPYPLYPKDISFSKAELATLKPTCLVCKASQSPARAPR